MPGRDPPSPGSGRDPPSRAPSQLRRFRAPVQVRHFRALSSSAVSYPWLGPPSPSPQRLRALGQLSFSSPGPAALFPNIPVREYLHTSSLTGPGLPTHTLKVKGQLHICPLFQRHWCRSFSLACARLNSIYRRVLPPQIG